MKKHRIKLRTVVTRFILFNTFETILAVTVLLFVFVIIRPTNHLFFKEAWIALLISFAAWHAIRTIACYQTATLDETRIVFRSPMREIARVQWTDIVKVGVQKAALLEDRFSQCEKYIVLYTTRDQIVLCYEYNKRNRPPWTIKYSEKNAETIREFLEKYSNIKPNIIKELFGKK